MFYLLVEHTGHIITVGYHDKTSDRAVIIDFPFLL